MAADANAFMSLRQIATGEFAQTMIIVDDEASQSSREDTAEPITRLRQPSRKTRPTKAGPDDPNKHAGHSNSGRHALDAKSIIDSAMGLGLICSILRPKKKENFQKRVVRAARVADIVCLDWEIHNDGGDIASKIVREILREDAQQNGRLRLIAIYTGDSTNVKILSKIFDAIPKSVRERQGFRQESLKIESKNGIKIICLFKTHGVRLAGTRGANQVPESQLPKRLLDEFSTLSEGLLSNVALATIASVRRSTHHVLSKFTGQMDGPLFHHRASIKHPRDAEEYAVEIVLSELKSAINKQLVASVHAGPQAIAARILEMAENDALLKLHYEDNGEPSVCDLGPNNSIRLVTDGLKLARQRESFPKSPGKNTFEENLATLFSDDPETARLQTHEFAALTSIRAYPKSHLYASKKLLPKLGLGSIVRNKNGIYLMCLQASCDSIRIDGQRSFLFVLLEKVNDDKAPEYVVPLSHKAHKSKFIGLSTPKESYRAVTSIPFSASQGTDTVNAEKIFRRPGVYFVDVNGNAYLWIADLKRRRALRTAQRLGQNMGRLGFDEFEPYRLKNT